MSGKELRVFVRVADVRAVMDEEDRLKSVPLCGRRGSEFQKAEARVPVLP
jgi:hypothetical protein